VPHWADESGANVIEAKHSSNTASLLSYAEEHTNPHTERASVVESRKQAVSIRMNTADIRRVKKLASRLGVRDSDVIRFAVKTMLAKLGPLYDPDVLGRNLVPVFVESGAELLRFFDIDASKLEAIINEDVPPERRVDHDDIELLALTSAQEPYAALKLRELDKVDRPRQSPAELSESLRQYLYAKYVYRAAVAADATHSITPIRLVALDQETA
jgi:predicted DNA binding CopG/RHH family protein